MSVGARRGGAPIRVLHVVNRMDRAGLETQLMHIVRAVDRISCQMDFLVQSSRPGDYDHELRELGSRILQGSNPHQPLAYARRLQSALRVHGPFDVVHSHVHHYSGWVLRQARRAGVAVRVAHSHTNTASVDQAARWPRRLYLATCKELLRREANIRLALSDRAGRALFSPPQSFKILPYGVDPAAFSAPVDRAAVRRELDLDPDALVVGHVGSFVEVKNHRFLLQVAQELQAKDDGIQLLLIGDGPLRPEIESRVKEQGLVANVKLLGARADVIRLLRGAVDCFVLPSLYEGLSLAALEAQAAGLPVVLATTVPPEVVVVEGLVQQLDLSCPPANWAEAILAAAAAGRRPVSEMLQHFHERGYEAEACARQLVEIYRNALDATTATRAAVTS